MAMNFCVRRRLHSFYIVFQCVPVHTAEDIALIINSVCCAIGLASFKCVLVFLWSSCFFYRVPLYDFHNK